jgi:hypothetical protein
MRIRGANVVMAVLLAAGLVASAGSWLRAQRAGEHAEALAHDLAALREQLAEASDARAKLEREVTQMRDAIAAAREDVASERVAAPSSAGAAAPDETDGEVGETTSAAPEVRLASALPSLDTDRLIAAGFSRDEVERFRTRSDEIALARLELRDRATREGWLDTPRFREESRALEEEGAGLRAEFGDALWDWALFASGQPNRVAVAEVLAGSAAESAGLSRGDVILRYDESLVTNAGELRDATTIGRAGELVAVEVQRDGESASRRVFVPRGPIGVRLAPALMEPSPRG